MRSSLIIATTAVLLSFCYPLHAQQSVKDSIVNTFLIHANYAFQFPGADLSKSFGNNSVIAVGLGYKTNKNWLWSAQLGFIFGDNVHGRNELLSLISTSTGEIIDGDGVYTSLALFERGYHSQLKGGKIVPFGRLNPNSGLYFQTGLGYLTHHIRIETQFGTAPQLKGDYAKGYDQLRGGVAHSMEAGFLFMGSSKVLNFSIGLEFIHAYTTSLRKYDFNLMRPDNQRYSDHYFGIRINWMVPVYKRSPQPYYYF